MSPGVIKINGENIGVVHSHGEVADVNIRFHQNNSAGLTTFNPIIAVKDGSILANSNSYIIETHYLNNPYEQHHKIFDNIHKNFKNIMSCTEPQVVTHKCFYLSNSFMDSNIGHAFSIIFYIFKHYKIDQSLKFVIPENTLDNIKKILLIFLNPDQIFQLQENVTYKFENIFFPNLPQSSICSIELQKEPVDKIIDHVKAVKFEEDLLNKKIFLVKRNNLEKYCSPSGYNITPDAQEYLLSKDVLIIKPEEFCIYKLIYLLLHASIIFTSPGAISYAHMIFFNKNAKLVFVSNPYAYSQSLNFTYIPDISKSQLQKFL